MTENDFCEIPEVYSNNIVATTFFLVHSCTCYGNIEKVDGYIGAELDANRKEDPNYTFVSKHAVKNICIEKKHNGDDFFSIISSINIWPGNIILADFFNLLSCY